MDVTVSGMSQNDIIVTNLAHVSFLVAVSLEWEVDCRSGDPRLFESNAAPDDTLLSASDDGILSPDGIGDSLCSPVTRDDTQGGDSTAASGAGVSATPDMMRLHQSALLASVQFAASPMRIEPSTPPSVARQRSLHGDTSPGRAVPEVKAVDLAALVVNCWDRLVAEAEDVSSLLCRPLQGMAASGGSCGLYAHVVLRLCFWLVDHLPVNSPRTVKLISRVSDCVAAFVLFMETSRTRTVSTGSSSDGPGVLRRGSKGSFGTLFGQSASSPFALLSSIVTGSSSSNAAASTPPSARAPAESRDPTSWDDVTMTQWVLFVLWRCHEYLRKLSGRVRSSRYLASPTRMGSVSSPPTPLAAPLSSAAASPPSESSGIALSAKAVVAVLSVVNERLPTLFESAFVDVGFIRSFLDPSTPWASPLSAAKEVTDEDELLVGNGGPMRVSQPGTPASRAADNDSVVSEAYDDDGGSAYGGGGGGGRGNGGGGGGGGAGAEGGAGADDCVVTGGRGTSGVLEEEGAHSRASSMGSDAASGVSLGEVVLSTVRDRAAPSSTAPLVPSRLRSMLVLVPVDGASSQPGTLHWNWAEHAWLQQPGWRSEVPAAVRAVSCAQEASHNVYFARRAEVESQSQGADAPSLSSAVTPSTPMSAPASTGGYVPAGAASGAGAASSAAAAAAAGGGGSGGSVGGGGGVERFGDSWIKAENDSRVVVSSLSLREVKRWTTLMSLREDENQLHLKRYVLSLSCCCRVAARYRSNDCGGATCVQLSHPVEARASVSWTVGHDVVLCAALETVHGRRFKAQADSHCSQFRVGVVALCCLAARPSVRLPRLRCGACCVDSSCDFSSAVYRYNKSGAKDQDGAEDAAGASGAGDDVDVDDGLSSRISDASRVGADIVASAPAAMLNLQKQGRPRAWTVRCGGAALCILGACT